MDRKPPVPRQLEDSRRLESHSRKHTKKKAPVIDSRKLSEIAVDAPTAVIHPERLKSPKDRELIIAALTSHSIFTGLTEEGREAFITEMNYFTISAKEYIFEQGEPGANFFVIASGRVQVLVNWKLVRELSEGDSFGELALLHDSPRSATIRTLEHTTLWGIERRAFRSAVERVNEQNYQETKSFIETVSLFLNLSSRQREGLIGSLSTLKYRVGEQIVREGDPGDLFYLITEGVVTCMQEGKELRKMYRGDFFGEQALLYNTPRTASIITSENVKCLAIGRDRLKKVLGSQLQSIIYRNSIVMSFDKSTVLKFTAEQVARIIENIQVKSYSEGDVVIPAETLKGSCLWIVVNGQLTQNGAIYGTVFTCVGEDDIRNPEGHERYTADVLARGDIVDIAGISRKALEQCIGGSCEQTVLLNQALSVMKCVNVFRGLPEEKFRVLIGALQLLEYSHSGVIVQQGAVSDSFFIINEGRVDVIKDGVNVRSITKHDYFGERGMLFNDRRTATVVALGDVSCWMLQKNDFLALIDEDIRLQLLKRIELQDDNIVLPELALVKTLGKGMFGNVFLAAHKLKNQLYAVKTVERNKIERYQIQGSLVLERKILLQIDHALIMKLVRTFKDEFRVYFLTEFVRGIDLFDVLRKLGLVREQDAKFYAACLITILEHLHDRDIIYRDLKPENVMVDEEGFPKLIDFGTAKIVDGRTFTIVGTPHYMAPEVVLGKGYGVTVDYWSVGIMLYEFLCGGVPFGEEEEDPYAIYQRVIEHKLVYTRYIDSTSTAKPLIEQLLNKNPAMRTGGSIEVLKRHPWFGDFNWEAILTRQLKTPYCPRLPDLSGEVQKALMRDQDMHGGITREEQLDNVPSLSGRRRTPAPTDWDAEF